MKAKSLVLAALTIFCVIQVRAADITPLAGQWRFALDRADAGIAEKWFAQDLAGRIQLPGILQAQGFGDDIATNTPWVASLGDSWWKIQPAELRERFSKPGAVKVPFLAQPPKHYLGAAWYQRDLNIPKDAKGKRITLFLERVHWKSTVWLDEQEIGSDISLGTPHEYELGTVAPGRHRLTIRVDNRTQLPVAGHLVDSHSISDALGAAWNGIVGNIELRSTPPVWLDDVQVYPDLSNGTARVVARIGNMTGKAGEGSLAMVDRWSPEDRVRTLATPCKWDTNGGTVSITIAPDGKQWSEFNPALMKKTLVLFINSSALDNTGDTGPFYDTRELSFGMREITTKDKDILVNGRPVNLRMTHFGGDFPLTGYPAMDVKSWRKIFQTCKDYGLNGMRFHSWCPPEAAFEAADELGFYLQPECSLWADFGNAPTREFLERETTRMLKAYGNHPSFVLLSPSNEPRNYTKYLPQWAATNYAQDPRRLYCVDSGWGNPAQLTGAQYAVVARFGNNRNVRNATGWFGKDFGDALTDVHIPVLAHEVGQWCAYPDFDVMKKFTGYLRPGNYEIFRYIAEQNGVLGEDKAFADASGRFQVACYKEEIEANLRTPGLAGFQLLDLHDYLGQGTALIGVLDTFWETKGYVGPDEWKHFCGPLVPLARLTNRVFTTADRFQTPVEIANFGEHPLANTLAKWRVLDSTGHSFASGQFPAQTIPLGKNIALGNIALDLSKLPAPHRYVLNVWGTPSPKGDSQLERLQAAQSPALFQNNWDFWLYPAQVEDSKATTILVTRDWNEAEKNLADGKKVLFIPAAGDLDASKCPPMKNVPVFWNIQMTVRPPQNLRPRFDAFLGLLCDTNHPALAEFPTDANCDWHWTPLINDVRAINLTAAPRELKPIVWAIDDWNRNWKLGVIFECSVGSGKLLVSAINVDDQAAGAEVTQLRRSLMDYMASSKFHPAVKLTAEQAHSLWSRGNSTTNEPARVFDPDLNDGSIPATNAPK